MNVSFVEETNPKLQVTNFEGNRKELVGYAVAQDFIEDVEYECVLCYVKLSELQASVVAE